MNGTTMVVLIVLISVGFGVLYDMYAKHLKFKERTLNANNLHDEQAEKMQSHIAALEERIQILEK